MKPMPISLETAQKLAAFLKVPLEHIMHMPLHILLQKLAEMAKADASGDSKTAPGEGADNPDSNGDAS